MADVSTPSQSRGTSKILWSDPPMTGILHLYRPKDTTIIVSNGIRVLFRESNFYINGQQCAKGASYSLRNCGALVNFEASVFHSPFLNRQPHGIFHRTDLAWIGEKPSLAAIAQTVGKVDPEVLSDLDKKFVGRVRKFCFPDIAILQTKRDRVNSIVCVKMESFVTGPFRSTLGNRRCILDFCILEDYVEFKVRANAACPLGVCAYLARRMNKKDYRATQNTSAHYLNKLSRVNGIGGNQVVESNLVEQEQLEIRKDKIDGEALVENDGGGKRSGGKRSGGRRSGGRRSGGKRSCGKRSGGNRSGGHS